MDGGWLKLYRVLTKKPIWKESSPEQKAILITILTLVNYEDEECEWQGEKFICRPGQKITTLEEIAREAGKGITIQNVRTSLLRFEKFEFLTSESTNKNRLITVLNWELYQGDGAQANKQANKQLTSNQQATNKQNVVSSYIIKNIRNKEIKESIYTEIELLILNHWNSKGITRCDENLNLQKQLKSSIKKFGKDKILQAIDNYSTVFNDKNYFYSHMWYLDKFLKQSNGVPEFLNNGQKWVNYLNEKKNSNQKNSQNKGNFEQRKYDEDYLNSLYENS